MTKAILSILQKAYFNQVPESFRNDHMKAIAAVTDANMDSKFLISIINKH